MTLSGMRSNEKSFRVDQEVEMVIHRRYRFFLCFFHHKHSALGSFWFSRFSTGGRYLLFLDFADLGDDSVP